MTAQPSPLLTELASDAVLDDAYTWLCQQGKLAMPESGSQFDTRNTEPVREAAQALPDQPPHKGLPGRY